jgi:outer membrane protein assembly factor BamE (lipoprotein component of BamABCDE complex)
MKKSISLVIIALLFVVLGCSLGSLTGDKEEAPTPATDTTSTTEKPADGDSTPASSDSSSGGTASLSMDKFNKIEFDMSYDQVKEIMGSEGNETSSSKSGSYESKSYEWKGDKFARVSTRFQNGKLVSKTQSSITDNKGTADLSQAKFNKINTGMTYEQVKEVIGSEGELTTTSQYGNSESASYTWKGPNYERVYTSYTNGKLNNKSQSNLK